MEFVCFVWISEQTASFAVHNINPYPANVENMVIS